MLKKYITLINQLIQGYHLEKHELDDLEIYLKKHLEQIQRLKFKPKVLDCGCCGLLFETWYGYKNQGQDDGYGICKDCQ